MSLLAQTYDHSRLAFRTTPTLYESLKPFYHGVASGDPLADRVIIWTRVTPEDLQSEVEVEWRVASDVEMTQIVQNGTFMTSAERDFTVKVDVDGLTSGQTYYYQFEALGASSLIGKTKTAPSGNESDHLRFGVVSCSNYQAGYFNNYGSLARITDLDAVIHLGDYIYEYANFVYGADSVWNDRLLEPEGEIVTIEDYRARYSTYRLDTNLIRAHQQHPFISIWDDHESANDAYVDGAENHDEMTQGAWETRKAVSKQVYFEWMPIRSMEDERIYRNLSYGDIADLILLDTRLEGRDEQILDVTNPALYDPQRTMLGAEQKVWTLDQLSQSSARWKILAQQVIFAEFNVGWAALLDTTTTFEATESIFLDIWDGYPAERLQLINHIRDNEIDDIVILTGDFHSAFAFDVVDTPTALNIVNDLPFYGPGKYNPETGEGSIAVEFATPSISSANFDENVGMATATALQFQINNPIIPQAGLNLGNPNPHMKYVDLVRHGYFVLDVKSDTCQSDYYFSDILVPELDIEFAGGFYTLAGENHLNANPNPSRPKSVQDELAPIESFDQTTSVGGPESVFQGLSLYPNPSRDEINLQFGLRSPREIVLEAYTIEGRKMKNLGEHDLPAGVYSIKADVSSLPPAQYVLKISMEGESHSQLFTVSR